jgi:hypothetical protein
MQTVSGRTVNFGWMLSQSPISRLKNFPLVFLIFQLFSVFIYGQTTVKGRVSDAGTFEPVVFANIVFKGTAIGVKTDFDGNFTLSATTTSDSITISFIGYETKAVGIKQGISQTLDIQLHPALYTLNEVRITPGENPAHILLRRVWDHSEANSIEKLSAYQYKNYSRSTVYLRKFGGRSDEERSIRLYAKEFDEYSVKTGDEGLPALPSYITESISDNFYLKNPKREYTYLKATTSDGIAFENTDLVAQLVNKQENFYFPDNTVKIIDKSFISPLSRFGPAYYKYYIVDSIVLDNRFYCYEIRFVPKREEDPVFHGSFWINDTTFALKRISVEVAKKAELNFIQRIKIQQDYEPAGSGAWFPVRTRFMADAVNIFVTNFSKKSDIIVNQPFDPGFYGSELKVNPGSRDHGSEYWNTTRTNSLDFMDSLAVQRIESLKHNMKVRVSAKLIEASIKGYYNSGWFEGGPWIMLYNYNNVEGSRFRLGGRTNTEFSKRIVLEGYLAYGTRDSRFKGSLQSEIFISKNHWTKFGLQYRDDVEKTGALDEFYSGSSFLTFATSFGGSDKMNRSQVMRGWFESDIFKGLTGKVVLTRKTFEPVSNSYSPSWYTDRLKSDTATIFSVSETGFILRYQPKAVYVVDGVRRFPVNFNKFPVFSFQYFRGFSGILNGDYSYDRFVTGISQHFNIGGIGSIEYDFSFTKVLGQLPYPLLITLAGNESVFRTGRTYNLMNYGEFVNDEALELYASYHMNGIILNKIPLIKKLQWRTVVSANAAFGSFDDSKNGYFDPADNPDGILKKPSLTTGSVFYSVEYNKPYAELSYGIENIFRFLRVDLVHRLTYLENPGSQRFAVKVNGVFRF